MLEFKNVSKTYPYEKYALIEDLSFTVSENETAGIVIEPQWGKTTVAKLIAGLQKPSGGEILLDGKPLEQTPPQERGIVIIYDTFALMKGRKFWVNAAYTLKIRKVKKRERKAAAIEALQKFELNENGRVTKKTPDADKLALVLARASLREARLVIFDDVFKKAECDTAKRLIRLLDVPTQIYLSSEVKELSFCDKIVIVTDGKDITDNEE